MCEVRGSHWSSLNRIPTPYLHVNQTGDRALDRHPLVAALSVVDPDLQVNSSGSYTGMSKLVLQIIERDPSIQGSDRVSVPQAMGTDYVQRPPILRRIVRTLNSSLLRCFVDHHPYPSLGDMLRRTTPRKQPDGTFHTGSRSTSLALGSWTQV